MGRPEEANGQMLNTGVEASGAFSACKFFSHMLSCSLLRPPSRVGTTTRTTSFEPRGDLPGVDPKFSCWQGMSKLQQEQGQTWTGEGHFRDLQIAENEATPPATVEKNSVIADLFDPRRDRPEVLHEEVWRQDDGQWQACIHILQFQTTGAFFAQTLGSTATTHDIEEYTRDMIDDDDYNLTVVDPKPLGDVIPVLQKP